MLRKIIRLRNLFTITIFSFLSIIILFTIDSIHSGNLLSSQQGKIQAVSNQMFDVSLANFVPELHEYVNNVSLIDGAIDWNLTRVPNVQNHRLSTQIPDEKPVEYQLQVSETGQNESLVQIEDERSKGSPFQIGKSEPDVKPKYLPVSDKKTKELLIPEPNSDKNPKDLLIPDKNPNEPAIPDKNPKDFLIPDKNPNDIAIPDKNPKDFLIPDKNPNEPPIPDKNPKEPLAQIPNKKRKKKHIVTRADSSYLKILREKGVIEPLPSGGERIRATPSATVQFPFVLKNLRPEDWDEDYQVFLNLTYYPWWETEECKNLGTSFTPPGTLNVRALASFPSSGNCWLRQLIERATGIFTGSMYSDTSLMKYGMYGEGVIFNSGMTIVQKTHGYTTEDYMHDAHWERVSKNHMKELNNTGILMIRNPFKALVSHRHLDVGGHTGFAPKAHFVGDGWKKFVLLKIKLWEEFYTDWLEYSKPENLCVVLYEDLVTNTIPVLKKILNFLGLPIDYHRLDCISKYATKSLKRKSNNPMALDSNLFTEELQQEIYKSIDILDKVLMEKMNLSLPLENYKIPMKAKFLR